ncbi:MAG: hypothetical protein GY797_20350, partial [Deltaproteobacteria bacterium]|nr:hypothetical protein [Deltaproteobacteria bacterium]
DLLPHTEVFSIEDFSKITSVGILTDWWQKRPTKIKVYEWENDRKGEMVGSRDYPHYLTLICGEDFLTQCSYPDKNGSATAQLLIPIETNTQKIAVVLDGLLSAPNKYVIFKGIRLYGFR